MGISNERRELLDKLCSKYYNRNFGNISKSEIDLIMFHYYVEELKNNNKDTSDYTISKSLGISQLRVRNLKQKDYLQNPPADSLSVQDIFIKLLETARIVKNEDKLEIFVKDVNQMMEIRNFLEQHECYDDYTLNPKILKCSFDFIIKIGELLDDATVNNSSFEELKRIIAQRNGEIVACSNTKELLTATIDDLSEVSDLVKTAKTIGKTTKRAWLTVIDKFAGIKALLYFVWGTA